MNKKQFHKRLKDIYSHTKRGEYDSSFEDIRDAFMADIIGKSDNGWDESIAIETINFAEHVFKVQPEPTRSASQVKPSDAEAELERFLTRRGLSYTHIPESDEQTPDGYIEGLNRRYLCEIKSPLLKFDHDAAPFGYKHATTHRKLLDAIHKAKRQLEKIDPEHSLPHILAYTSAHFQLNYSNFIDAVRGYVGSNDGHITTDLQNTKVFMETKNIIDDIDLYVWFQIGGSKQFNQVDYFNNQHSVHVEVIDEFISHLKSEPISTRDNHVAIQAIRSEPQK